MLSSMLSKKRILYFLKEKAFSVLVVTFNMVTVVAVVWSRIGAGSCLLILQDFGLEFLLELHMEKVSCEVLPFNLPVT